MPLLDAIIAFAVTMLAVATAVTAITQLIRKLGTTKRDGLKEFLEEFYEEELSATVKTELARLGSKAQDATADKLEATADALALKLKNRVDLPPPGDDPVPATPIIDAKKLVYVSTEEMVERLKRSQLGIDLMNDLKENAEQVFDKLGERFEALGRRSTEAFRSRTQFLATVVAIPLAFAINIDSLRLASTYLNDQETRGAAIGQAQAVLARAESQISSAELPELKAALDEVKGEVAALSGGGFPIGWTYFPFSQEARDDVLEDGSGPATWSLWVLGCILTGLLAGLGAPFWHDLVTQMTRLATSAVTASKETRARKQTA